ncbi:MAG: hypothetical protein HUU21_39805 [Polyangiaceae bacterium]|nr:hypothetical protein [Polyangiaceae bacterium]
MRLKAWFLALTVALCAPQVSFAQTQKGISAEVHAKAEEQFRLGRKAQDNGDFKPALEYFRASHALEPGRGKLLNIAICEKEIGLLATAMQHFQEVLPQLAAGDPRIAIVKKNIAELEPRLPHFTISLASGAPPGSVVTLDGSSIAPSALGTDIPVDPGDHVILVTAAGRPDRRYELKAEEGKKIVLEVEPGAVPLATAQAPLSTDAPRGPNTRRLGGFIAGGVGIAGLAVGGLTGALALSDHSDVEEQCPTHRGCSQEVIDQASRGKSLSIASTVAFAAGAVGVGVGLYLVLSSGESTSAPAVGLTLSPDGGRVGLRGSF